MSVSVSVVLTLLGGVATRSQLIAATSRAEVDQAVAAGEVVMLARGRCALPQADTSLALAHELSAVLSHRHAAVHWGWAVKVLPEPPDITVARNRHLSDAQVARVRVHRAMLSGDDVTDGVTSRDRTLVDCLRNLPLDQALAIADSALRDGFSHRRLAALARDTRGPGAAQVRHVAGLACVEAANPFESVLRAIALAVGGLSVRPQVPIYDPDFLGRPDLVDEDLRIVLEADSFEWHGGRAVLARDARRYHALVVSGWLVLRFSWEDVMHRPQLVRETLVAAVARRTKAACAPGATA
ncbi:MAG: endonuclease domain-containing protein [Nocardioides sp.]|nr:endonuclease domain-containing protein [Nocardioides sp.]